MSHYLNKINSPDDLKKLTLKQCKSYCREIRSLIIETCAKTGGHLGASLGVVELSVALHRTFDSPSNPIVWDVGHQSYAHKIITGRCNSFHSIRQENGLSGFTKREESSHDIFGAGHASTSISAALGIAEAKRLKNDPSTVIAVIGDGALTGGLAYEALNNAGHLKTSQLLIILNDNKMSIAPNVGAISEHFKNLVRNRSKSKNYNQLRNRIKPWLLSLENKIPASKTTLNRLRTSLKDLVGIGGFFEDLGLRYVGPIDGHDLKGLTTTLESLKNSNGTRPVLLHLMTKKGKGFKRAEMEPSWSHGPSPYDPVTGASLPTKSTLPKYTEIFSNTLTQIAEKRKDIVAITAAMPSGTGLSAFAKKYPSRFFDVGIAEQHATVFAAGLATQGLKPVVAIYSTFLQRAYDGIIHDVALQNLPVVFALDRAGLVGADGPTHHGVFDLSYLRCIPNLVIFVPRDENQLQHHLLTATQLASPSALRYPRGEGIGVSLETPKTRELGQAEILFHQNGQLQLESILIWGVGPSLYEAITAAKILVERGYSVTVVDPHTIKPIDETLLKNQAKKADLIVTIEENATAAGFGSLISEILSQEERVPPSIHLGIPDRFIEHGNLTQLKHTLFLDADGILHAIENRLKTLTPFHKGSHVPSAHSEPTHSSPVH